jgi:hypothetical protein
LDDTKCIFQHDLQYPEMTGNQLSCHFTQENRLKINGKKVDYLPLSLLLSFETHVIAYVSRLQKRGVVRCQKQPAPFIVRCFMIMIEKNNGPRAMKIFAAASGYLVYIDSFSRSQCYRANSGAD